MKRLLYLIIAIILAISCSSCAQKRFLVIEDDRIGEDCRATDTADTADGNKTSDTDYSDETKETEVNEPDDPDWDTLPETLEDIDGVARGESLVFELSVNKEYYIVVDYTGTANVVDIPAVHLGKPVREIGERAFENSIITSVTIPDSIIEIGKSAFYYCTLLESLKLPNSVIRIEEAAFAQCHSLKSVDVGEGVKIIEAFAFLHCRNLSDIELPRGIEYIYDDAFQDTAYYNNPSNWIDNVLYIRNYLIEASPEIEGEYTVREGTALIAANAFYNKTKLIRVDMPNSVGVVCGSAFAYCTNLETVSFGDAVIAETAFNGCDNIKTVYYTGALYDITAKKETLTENDPLLDAEWVET
ncbi:MAG: leucine-rich repeat domain-containing protein [Clostridia bacterium]|nr:leucine-rich repeat domain-containing protein [Clostridia bacterium]